MSKNSVITSRSELLREFRRLLETDPDLQWISTSSLSGEAGIHSLRLHLDAAQVVFRPSLQLAPQKGALPDTHLTFDGGKRDKGTDSNPIDLIVTVRLTRRMIDWCKTHDVSAIDLNGRAWLRGPGLMVDRPAIPDRDFHYQIEPRNIFVGKSERIVRSLLSDVTRTWRQSELVARTGVSSGLVSRVTKHLVQEGYLTDMGRKEYVLGDWDSLLDDWAAQDSLPKRVTTYRYSVFGGDPVAWTRSLQEACSERAIRISFTQWIAGWMRKPYTEPVVTSAYIDRFPDVELLERLGYREVPDGGKIWLHVPHDEGVFREIRDVQGLPLVTDAQIFVDLQRTGLRGPDQAAALRESKDFCHPPP